MFCNFSTPWGLRGESKTNFNIIFQIIQIERKFLYFFSQLQSNLIDTEMK